LKDKQSSADFDLAQLRVDFNAMKGIKYAANCLYWIQFQHFLGIEKQKETAMECGKLKSELEEEKHEVARLKAHVRILSLFGLCCLCC